MNLILCGMMGCGKTTVGRALAKTTGKSWRDTDDLIVEKHGKIAEIFARYGEARFREMETETVRELSQKDNLIISTGGGLVLKTENVAFLKKKGRIVYLRANLETLLGRLQKDVQRPLLQAQESLSVRLTRLLTERSPIYESVCDYVVDVDGKTPDEIVREVVAWVDGR